METPLVDQTSTPKRLRIGCALLPKKVARYLTTDVLTVAQARGIDLCLINISIPLAEQGPYDAIIHKLRPNKDWESNLLSYAKANPNVKIIDRVDGIRTLQNRATMLSPLSSSITFQVRETDKHLGLRNMYRLSN
jgi:inositol-1,3,4-trisphosphate 5/6-kinase/inositol-tetrakisphosphate 1-kinase